MDIFQIDWDLVISHTLHLMIAYVLALPIGWDREQSQRHFGSAPAPGYARNMSSWGQVKRPAGGMAAVTGLPAL